MVKYEDNTFKQVVYSNIQLLAEVYCLSDLEAAQGVTEVVADMLTDVIVSTQSDDDEEAK